MNARPISARMAAVADHAHGPGTATTIASHIVAANITPCTHQRRGTKRRSRYSGSPVLREVLTRGEFFIHPSAAGDRVRRVSEPLPSTASLEVALHRLDPGLPLPSYAHPGDAGADLMTAADVRLAPGERALVPTG